MSGEKDFLVLTSLVAIGIIFISALVIIFQSKVTLPLLVIAIIITPFILYQNKENNAKLSEQIEKIAFFVTFIVICILMIVAYKPI
ncbi:hypothetical protein [uncultured Methanobrevibacter sp.]|uniref:hypothetical protein n=1 Tax=uncultured Methanobrevibacter sp. TaxID=253161 RepID=UPI0025ED2D63|nr:hypothetical protein [uncultured Methanobrevibacter sp.]